MNCSSCGANLPPEAAACPMCGTPTPYNVRGPGSSGPYDPTAISSGYGTPSPSTGYGAPTYGAPPSTASPYDPYAVPQQMPPNPYTAPPSGGYGPVPPPQIYSPPPKQRSRVGLIVGIVLAVVLLACVGVSVAIYQGLKTGINSVVTSTQATSTAISATATTGAGITPTTGVTPTTSAVTPTTGLNTPPSGNTIDPTAASIITSAKTAVGVDSNFYPTTVANTFTTQQTIYVTFNLNLKTTGYAIAKWYLNGQYLFKDQVLSLDKTTYDHGYFPSSSHYSSAGQGSVELYWCSLKDCSDARLADVVNFTVTSTGLHWTVPPVVTNMDMYNKEG